MKEGQPYDTIVIGAGQAGLASAYYLKRAGSRFLVLDGASHIGESWLRRWDSLRLFTPVRYSSLPGLPFPGEPYTLPVKDDVAKYLQATSDTRRKTMRTPTRDVHRPGGAVQWVERIAGAVYAGD